MTLDVFKTAVNFFFCSFALSCGNNIDIVDVFKQKLENVLYSTECIKMPWVS